MPSARGRQGARGLAGSCRARLAARARHDLVPLQPQAVGHDEDRGQRHGGRGDDRVEEAEGGERERGRVVAERPPEVAADGPERGAGKPDRVRDRPQVVAEQDQVGGGHRDVRAGPEGQPEVGRRERGGVVDAVADHRHLVPLRLQPGDDGGLVGRQCSRDDLVDAGFRGDGPRGRLVVPGQQDRVQPELAQFGDRGGGRGLDRVGDRDGAPDLRRPSRSAPRCGRPAPIPGTARPARAVRPCRVRRTAAPAPRPPRGRRRRRAPRVPAGP